MTRSLLVALLATTSSMLCAQSAGDQSEQYRVTDLALRQNTAEVEQLLDMRMRHDLGLLGALDENIVRIDRPLTTREMAVQQRELDKLENNTQHLRAQYQKLATQARLLAEAAKASVEPVDEGLFIPGAGRPAAGSNANGSPRVGRNDANRTAQTPPAPLGEVAKSGVTSEDLGALALDPLRAQIHGSKDHLRVAKALFKVGLALVDRGEELRAQGQIEKAKDLDQRAKIKLDLALAELKPLLDTDEPEFVTLFYQGRCLELLFRYSERHEGLSLTTSSSEFQDRAGKVRKPFLAISARDMTRSSTEGGREVLGLWGQAAKTAMEHFRWMNINAGYDQSPKIQSLTWPGEDKL